MRKKETCHSEERSDEESVFPLKSCEKQIPRFPTPASQNRARWGPRFARDDNFGLSTLDFTDD